LDWLKHPPAVSTVGELRQHLAQQPNLGIHPDRLYELGEQLGYTVSLSWWGSSQDGSFDAVFCRNNSTSEFVPEWEPETVAIKPWTDYTNNPLYGKLVQKLVPQVRELSQQQLPSYMVPQTFVLLDALPLTPNGKVDRRALPTADLTRNLATGFVSPQTRIEAQLVRVWSEVLGIERIGIKDNFFELGGHSLLATQVISRLRDLFAVELSLQNLLEYPTVSGLAQTIEILLAVHHDRMAITKPSADYEEGEF
jgi:acyl carrier protein